MKRQFGEEIQVAKPKRRVRASDREDGRRAGRAVWPASCAVTLALLVGGAAWLGNAGAPDRSVQPPRAEVFAPAGDEAAQPDASEAGEQPALKAEAIVAEPEAADAAEAPAPEPTPTPTPTPAPMVDVTPFAPQAEDRGASLSGKLWVNGSLEPVVLESGKRRAQLAWSSELEPESWRVVIYDSDYDIALDQRLDGANRGILLNCADFAEDSYHVVVTARALRDGEWVQLEAQNGFELRGVHQAFGERVACSRQLLAYIDGGGRVRLASGATGIEGEAMLGEGVDWKGLDDAVQVAVGSNHVVALTRGGVVQGAGGNGSGQLDCIGLEAVRQIAAGDECTACVLDNGRVRLFGMFSGAQYALSQVEDADSVSISQTHVIVLRRDGTALALPLYDDSAPTDVSGWTGLAQVAAGYDFCLGLRTDGAVLYAGPEAGDCAEAARWRDISTLAAGNGYALGVKNDGTAVSAGDPALKFVNVSDWQDISAVAAGFTLCAGLHTNGSLVLSAQ